MEQNNELSPKLVEQVGKLKQKYDAMGQDLSSYLEGLLYANYLTYWDYIHLDTLLSLQNPKTDFPDEEIFIIYHQITELYFKMVLAEIKQIAYDPELKAARFAERMGRVNRYFKHLVSSFDIMVDGMDKEQFLRFRMSLLPSSGFQSAQYRMIEVTATPLSNLVDKEMREQLKGASTEEQFQYIYWKNGATELSTGKKTLTLRQFERKYMATFISMAKEYEHNNLWMIYKSRFHGQEGAEAIAQELRTFDLLVNVNWPLAHFKSAVRYLQQDPEVISATGGTNWQKYLPPRFQLRIFYPELWTEEEKANWGRGAMRG
jgi:tryptophan 2,3-dioxygenase